jgi:hypothetical protein
VVFQSEERAGQASFVVEAAPTSIPRGKMTARGPRNVRASTVTEPLLPSSSLLLDKLGRAGGVEARWLGKDRLRRGGGWLPLG